MKIAITGCGPAGLMAALAVEHNGHEPVIYSIAGKSPLYGAQYLHRPIPEVSDPDQSIDVAYVMLGNPDAYRRRVYGDEYNGSISSEELDSNHKGWDIRAAYDKLWNRYEHSIRNVHINADVMGRIINEHTAVINSIPMPSLCAEGHIFRSQEVWAAGDAPELGIDVGKHYPCADATVLCNGGNNYAWYRISNIFGYTTVEWPIDIKPVLPSTGRVYKPLGTNCSCWPGVQHVGRYGRWQKGILSHTAYYDVHAWLSTGIDDPLF